MGFLNKEWPPKPAKAMKANENQELGLFYEKHSTFVENAEERSKILAIETEKYVG